MTERNQKTQEIGYRPVLMREETKLKVQQFRRGIGSNRDLAQERRLITAAVELVVERPDLHREWLGRISDIVHRDLESQQKHAAELTGLPSSSKALALASLGSDGKA